MATGIADRDPVGERGGLCDRCAPETGAPHHRRGPSWAAAAKNHKGSRCRPSRRLGGPEARPRDDGHPHPRWTPAARALSSRQSEGSGRPVRANVSVDVRLMKGEVRQRAFQAGKGAEDDRGRQGCALRLPHASREPAYPFTTSPKCSPTVIGVDDVRVAYPSLTEAQIEAAVLYARAYPRRGRPRQASPSGASGKPVISSEVDFRELPPGR